MGEAVDLGGDVVVDEQRVAVPALAGLFGSAPGRLVKVASEAKGSSAGVWR
jgi:hypothetical protein